ncbi:general secretion pathway protein GspB [Vibrio sp. S9_S30]|uniref:general secretion pathway protein GspB n=1 Tax=Vibrio sp. S9_S30 TaxID=2720226 RepID=UPI001681793B|nr:general secretion pathway protein GspB [Vibrio sp. S9_S30]MBD1555407.1 general secretion pathway protein GspB [Vibrio sp. S9_S30]
MSYLNTPSTGFSFLKLMVFVVPAVLVSSWQYMNYQPDSALVIQVKTVKEPLAKVITYPEPKPLKDMPTVDEHPTEVRYDAATETARVLSTQARPEAPIQLKPQEQKKETLDNLDLSSLSPELAQAVQSAIHDTAKLDSRRYDDEPVEAMTLETTPLEATPLLGNERRFRGKLPALNLQTHMYASSKDRRWVKVNGKELKEGDWVDDQVMIKSITPRTVVVEFAGQKIELPALHEWR